MKRKWLKIYVLLIVLLLTISGTACSKSVDNPADTTVNQNTSENTGNVEDAKPNNEVTFSITPPSDWNKVDGSTALGQYEKDGASFIITRDTVPSTISGYDGFIDFVKERFNDTFKNVEFEGTEVLSVNGYDSRLLTFTCDVAGFKMKYMVAYIFRDGYAYTLTGGTLGDEFAEVESDYHSFINSFEFN